MAGPSEAVLLALTPPFRPLSSDSINSITKRFLMEKGLPMEGGRTAQGVQALVFTSQWACCLRNCVILGSGKICKRSHSTICEWGRLRRRHVAFFLVHKISP